MVGPCTASQSPQIPRPIESNWWKRPSQKLAEQASQVVWVCDKVFFTEINLSPQARPRT